GLLRAPASLERSPNMVGELNKIFDKNFVVGYAIPASAFIAASMGLLHGFQQLPSWLQINPDDPLKDTTFVALVPLSVAIVLMAFNRVFFRILEGYWWFDLGHYLSFYQRWRWRRLSHTYQRLLNERATCEARRVPFSERSRHRLRMAAYRFAQQFPNE